MRYRERLSSGQARSGPRRGPRRWPATAGARGQDRPDVQDKLRSV